MISQEQAKELDKMDLDEELSRKMEVLGLCIQGIVQNHQCSSGLSWAFEDADTLAREMKRRLWENNNQNED